MEPTPKQAISTNSGVLSTYQSYKRIDLVRLDERTRNVYILEHRNDDEAFHIYIDRRRAQSPKQMPMTIEEAEADLQRRFGQQAS
ncbi:hypothetical protein LC613_15695 [Nostoc sphaeroides CHAB 2801]|uniref:DUF6887 family protein n=1 Tax=Nostoc sphaeroides TaxID=446679 RepID=UPI001E60E483|nr:hypothetical protein [Nostoc sphaeroides]MCC5629427.1 hypothetical protein [Nostoc sphaeroides CHAB 2801]